jgi:hypothetical protein
MSISELADGVSWRETELGLREVVAKYPDVSPFVILKIDLQRRGAKLTERAVAAIDPSRVSTFYRGINLENGGSIPNGILLRDGTSVLCTIETESSCAAGRYREPYVIDYEGGKFLATDEGEVVDEIDFWPNPDFTNKVTSRGVPMWHVLMTRPQRFDINLYQTCDFWKLGQNCKFCVAGAVYGRSKGEKAEIPNLDDIEEAVVEALKQPGRYRMVFLCSGTIMSGVSPQDDEVNLYIDMLKRIGKYFEHGKVMSQIVATAFTENQLRRLYGETILCGYTADLEVLDEDLFNWVCPGKAKHIGYREWKNRLYKAVDIFGPGRVTTGIVSGLETARPHGFETEDAALEKYLAETDELARHGVGVAQTIFHAEPGAVFYRQKIASLDYLVAYARGADEISRWHGLEFYYDDYRTCGNHPNIDLARSWQGVA